MVGTIEKLHWAWEKFDKIKMQKIPVTSLSWQIRDVNFFMKINCNICVVNNDGAKVEIHGISHQNFG